MSGLAQHTSKASRRYDLTAMVFCIAVLILALVIGYFRKVGNFGVETDFYGAYAKQAENIMAGRSYTYQHNPPGYSLLLAAVSLLTGDLFVAAKIITAFATALFGWVTYLLFKALFDSRIALVSTTLLLITLVPFSFLAATDIVGALLVILPVWILLRRPVLTFKACSLAGVLAGVAYLFRYNAIFVVAGIGFSLLFVNPDRETLPRRLVRIGFFVGGVLVISCPWLIINWRTNGSPFASTAYLQVAAHFYHPAGDIFVMQEAFEFNSLLDVVLYDPPRFLWKYLTSVLYSNVEKLTKGGLEFPAYLFAGAGFLLLLRDLSRRRLAFLVVYLLGYLLSGLVGFYLRYYYFIFPFLFLLVAYFLFQRHVFRTLGYVPFFRIAVSWLIVIIVAAFLSKSAYSKTRSAIASEPRHLLEIADLLQTRSSPDDVIIALKSHYAYLSGLKRAFPVAQTPDDYLETADDYLLKAREIGARYIAYSDYEASLWPGLKSLSAPNTVPNGFKLIYRHEPTNTLIYEINSDAQESR